MAQQIDKNDLYPFIFEPIYKQVIWGGTKLSSVLNRQMPKTNCAIGESIEICDRPEAESMVMNGSLAGTSIHTLVKLFGAEFVGAKFIGDRFPIIVKYIDSEQDLSLQVHPGEEAQQILQNGAESKQEMWYIVDADSHAKVYAGLRNTTSRQQFLDLLDSPEIIDTVQCFDSIPGDAYFLNSGRIHFVGSGNLLLEVSSNSVTSFRITDWGRIDRYSGKARELHRKEALVCLDFLDRTSPRISGVCNSTEHNRKYPLINHCPHFHCDDLKLVAPWCDTTETTKSFHILSAINSPIAIENNKFRTEVPFGHSVLIPACFGEYTVLVVPNTTTTIIKTTIA